MSKLLHFGPVFHFFFMKIEENCIKLLHLYV